MRKFWEKNIYFQVNTIKPTESRKNARFCSLCNTKDVVNEFYHLFNYLKMMTSVKYSIAFV